MAGRDGPLAGEEQGRWRYDIILLRVEAQRSGDKSRGRKKAAETHERFDETFQTAETDR